MDYDESSRSHLERKLSWIEHYDKHYGARGVERLASAYRDDQHCQFVGRINGGFNICFKVVFDDGIAWAVRFPIPGWVMDPEQKIHREVAVIKYLQGNTRIPVPRLVAHGSASDNHDPKIGPFIISEWVDGVSLVSLMEKLPRPSYGMVLRKDLDDDFLYKKYCCLEMSEQVGGSTSWSIRKWPLTLKMNEIESHGHVVVDAWTDPRTDHEAAPFDTAADYMNNLLEQNIKQLYEQRNSIDSAEDARCKFVLRRSRRMQALVPYFKSRLNTGPFKLFCDDMHPRNVLIDEHTHQITAIIGWEWTYAAPREFSLTPPSWLALEGPSGWNTSSEVAFGRQMSLFLQALEDVEQKRESTFPPKEPGEPPMSTVMRQNFEDGTFRFVQLLLKSFNFDEEVIWPNLERVLQRRGLLEVGVPSEEEIEAFVVKKMKDLDEYNRDLQTNPTEQKIEAERQST
ncbi:hypothetical protein AUEXF2481DRAFT_27868 [Aureobasidium subglaciale EXF-2481]|uniref:Uncharacterized protein n=1 Tax=Aureobasidium subglaciale (strain EXF-2481) TaxID=1043005 RepID=A0A074YL11_AURSE|nr:uncharacterized protein AUEXF2481DRAFT_27868 [Aureobasidium subglaciale EXF-2481]KEQ96729.1 hypothetical protein AUEXF2481DRAFT_27868 [Aureobasidium subglaciale EXF-2481]